MYEFTCEYCGITVIANDKSKKRRFCSYSCSGRAAHGVKPIKVDLSYDWKSIGIGGRQLWICRYNEHISCKDRNCAACGWNPAVAEARLAGIIEKRKAELA